MAEEDFSRVLGVYWARGFDPSFWAEPANALTNAGFVIAGAVALVRHREDRPVVVLACITIAIGIGSFLFHTLATRAAMIADVAPIQAFIAVYFFLAMRRFVGLSPLKALAAAAATPCCCRVTNRGGGSAVMWGGLLGLLGLGAGLTLSGARTGRAAWVACLFGVSLAFRTLDGAACGSIETGTHPVWHMLNAVTLYALMGIMARRPVFDPISR